jgi:hypothetical protein
MVKFDLDGVLIDFVSIADTFLKESGYERIRPQTSYPIKCNPEISNDKLWSIFNRVYREWERTPIFSGASELMEYIWQTTTEPIQIITARPLSGADSAHRICRKIMNGIPHSIAVAKSGREKYLHLKPGDILIEDCSQTALSLSDIGIASIIIDNEYNQIDNEDSIPEILGRVSNLHELLDFLVDIQLYLDSSDVLFPFVYTLLNPSGGNVTTNTNGH